MITTFFRALFPRPLEPFSVAMVGDHYHWDPDHERWYFCAQACDPAVHMMVLNPLYEGGPPINRRYWQERWERLRREMRQ